MEPGTDSGMALQPRWSKDIEAMEIESPNGGNDVVARSSMSDNAGSRRRSSVLQNVASLGVAVKRHGSVMGKVLTVGRQPTGDFSEIPVDFSETRKSRFSIFDAHVEDLIEEEQPEAVSWLQSVGGVIMQLGICFIFIGLYSYEVIFKKLMVDAVKSGASHPVDNMSFIIAMGLSSITIGVALAARSGHLDRFKGKEALHQLLRFSPCGFVVASTNYLTFIILAMIDADTFKVILQLRLIGVAAVSWLALGKKQSVTSWFCLLLTLLSAAAFTQAKELDLDSQQFQGLLGSQATVMAKSSFENVNLLMAKIDDTSSHDTYKALLNAKAGKKTLATLIDTYQCVECARGRAGGKMLGYLLTLGYVAIDSCNAVYEQKLLQGGADTPFYVQMTFKLIPYTVTAFLLKITLAPLVAKPGDVSIFKEGFFYGWGNAWAILTFLSLVGKEWFQGIVIKKLNSMVRQLCGVVSVALLYFLLKMHGASESQLSLPIILIDLSVMFSVLAYANSQMAK